MLEIFEEIEDKPLVTVLIPSYNHESYVLEAIQSIIDQDYTNIELIVIDDGSSDNSVATIEKIIPICLERFKRFEFRSRPNKGLCATLNEALSWSEGEFFSPMASDDIALPHKISFLVNKIKDSNYAVVFGMIQPFGELIKSHINLEKMGFHILHHTFEDLMLHINLPSAPAAMLRKSSVINVGGYAEDVKLEDRYMWLSLTNKGEQIVSFPEIITLYRMHNTNTVNNIKKMQHDRVHVLNKFSESPLHSESIKKSWLQCSEELSNEEIFFPIAMILKSKNYNKRGFFTIVRAIMPKYLMSLLRGWRSG